MDKPADSGPERVPDEVLNRSSRSRPLFLGAWGFFLIWIALVKAGRLGPGAGLIGTGVIIVAQQGARHLLSLSVEGLWLLAGTVLFGVGLWKISGADFSLLPFLLFAAGCALLVSAWKSSREGH